MQGLVDSYGEISTQPPAAKETLDELLDRVSDARETLISVERTLERLRSDIAALDTRKNGPRKNR